MTRKDKIRVLIVDDSAIARDMIARGLSRDPSIEVVGKASDAWSARDKIVMLHPDVITVDVEMPGMDGIEFIRRLLPQYPVPVIIVSAVTLEGSRRALEAMQAGAMDIVAKPEAGRPEGLSMMIGELAERIREAAGADMNKLTRHAVQRQEPVPSAAPAGPARTRRRQIIAIGASTGGTGVLNDIIPQFPHDMPGVVVVQHMPPVFTRMFAESLDRLSGVDVKEAVSGDLVRPGLVLIAPGDFQMTVHRKEGRLVVQCRPGEKVSGHRPSVDVLFSSVALAAGERAVGVLLTGMGRDGADGLLEMRRSGARCLAQDEESSVVFGMPKEAWDNGAAEELVSTGNLTSTILRSLA